MLGRTPDTIKAVRPLQDVVIADFSATQLLLKNLIQVMEKLAKIKAFIFIVEE